MALLGASTLVKFFDAETGELLRKFQWKLGPLRCVAFSPDGTLAAAGSEDGKIVVWDMDE
jgi:WD40 repeat protein